MDTVLAMPSLFEVDRTYAEPQCPPTDTNVKMHIDKIMMANEQYQQLLTLTNPSKKARRRLYSLGRVAKNPLLGNYGTVYVVRLRGHGERFLKVGITSNINNRFSHDDMSYAVSKLLVTRTLPAYDAHLIEQVCLSTMFGEFVKPINHSFSGYTECVADTPQNLANLKETIRQADTELFFRALDSTTFD